MSEKLVISFSRRRLLFHIGNAFLFVVGGVWICWWGWEKESGYLHIFSPVMGSLGILFFGYALVFGIRRLFDPTPGLILDSQGMTDLSSVNAGGLILWQDISCIYSRQYMGQSFLCIGLNEEEVYLAKQPVAKRKLMEQNRKMVGAPVCLSPLLFSMTLGELETTLVSYWEANRSPYRASIP